MSRWKMCRAELLAFPDSPGSGEIAFLGALVLLAGAALGLPGKPSRRGKLFSAAGSAIIALLTFLGLVALLPDTRLPELLLACVGAALAPALLTLRRLAVLRRREEMPDMIPAQARRIEEAGAPGTVFKGGGEK